MCILGHGLVPKPRAPHGASTDTVQVLEGAGVSMEGPQGSHLPQGALSCSLS